MRSGQLEQRESILIRGEAAVCRFIQIDKSSFDNEKRHHWSRRILRDNQCVRLASRLVDVGSGLSDPIVFQVTPVTSHGVPVNGADMVMGSNHRPGNTFQNKTESSTRDVEQTGLEPHTIRVRDPQAIVVEISVCNEMVALS